ncbi:hypothetical protein BN59_02808 [Legionella massiliensis]|uniref:Uncharacterized protein n=1 Tax=Legionella massiliensis TaxID=1034943 RepID=A0A078L3H9_9GAMM|nr:hypothetical protein [Legionella massiliensis]CDZ78498.1 hypothetical protein BN59_02808 [Legionella massiliensis]CEE14236.1 hypothetical protein BN1094_02808 [Legionella massiliensis]
MGATSSILNQQGSFTALSLLASNPEAQLIAGAVIGGVAVTVAGAAFIYKEFKAYKEKKHLNEINAINKLHEEHLSKIVVPGKNEILSLPVIFKFKTENDLKTVESLHYNEDIVRTKANKLPGQTDIALSLYQEAIRDAILKLKEYYFSRSDNNDTTGSVLSYLLEMLDSHCLKFEGYDYDIAYLKAIAAFIDAYASQGNNQNTKRFSHLDEVYSNIVKAQHLLDLHKDVLSLQELLSDLYDSCRNMNDEALRVFTMMINPRKHWKLMETVTKKELSQGMLKKYFIEGSILGLINIPDNETDILDSPFKDDLIHLVKYALSSIDPEKTLALSDIPKVDVQVPNLGRYIELRDKDNLTQEEKTEKKGIKKQLEAFKSLFYESKNFVTLEMDPKTANSKHKYIPVSEYDEVVNRAGIMINFANLIRKIISLQYYSINLIKGIKSLGEIDVSNKYHRKIFNVLDELCAQIQNDYLRLKTDLYKIQESSNNAMHIDEITKHRERIYALLETTNTTIGMAKDKIKKYWHKNREKTAELRFDAEYNLFTAAHLIAKTHDLPCAQETEHRRKSSSHQSEKARRRTSHHVSSQSSSSVPQSSSSLPKKPIAAREINTAKDQALQRVELVEKQAAQANVVNSNSRSNLPQKPEQIAVTAREAPNLADNIQYNFSMIKKSIILIRKEERPAASDHEGLSLFAEELAAYLDLSSKLDLVNQKIQTINDEENLTDQRKTKNQHLAATLAEVTERVTQFVQLKRKERIKQAAILCRDIQKILTQENHATFIDDHKDSFWRYANSVFGAGFFRTDSRIKLSNVSSACSNLMEILSRESKTAKIEYEGAL